MPGKKTSKRQDHKGVMTIEVTQSDRKCGWQCVCWWYITDIHPTPSLGPVSTSQLSSRPPVCDSVPCISRVTDKISRHSHSRQGGLSARPGCAPTLGGIQSWNLSVTAASSLLGLHTPRCVPPRSPCMWRIRLLTQPSYGGIVYSGVHPQLPH